MKNACTVYQAGAGIFEICGGFVCILVLISGKDYGRRQCLHWWHIVLSMI